MPIDKDTWMAENILPINKHTHPIKLRQFVNPVSINNSHRKTRISLCVLGSWAVYMPPYNLAKLTGLLRASGYNTTVFDFNVDSYHELTTRHDNLKTAWDSGNYWWWSQLDQYNARIHYYYEPILRDYMNVLLESKPDIIGFSLYYTNKFPTYWLINEIKKIKPSITIILGGSECNSDDYTAPKNVDYFFVGESEKNLLDFLEDWELGIKPSEQKIGSLYSDIRIDLNSLPYADYTDYDLQKYISGTSMCIEFSRGCVAKCTYCSETLFWKYRDRSYNNIVDEIEFQNKRYGVTHYNFVDSLINGNLKELKSFCEELLKRDIKVTWWAYARCDGRMNLEFYKLLKAAGAQGFNYGIESGSDNVLKLINKKNTVSDINQNLIDSALVGMKASTCFVIGSPGESIQDYMQTLNLLWNHRKRIMAISPGPGLGDTLGSDYDNREKYNLQKRGEEWLGGWYTLDFKLTPLHLYIRVKIMQIWLVICKDNAGTFTNLHHIPNIINHYTIKFDSNETNENLYYEQFDCILINSGQGVFADTAMNEIFSFLRMLWRAKGGFELKLNFDPMQDQKDLEFMTVTKKAYYKADIYFKIDSLGNYETNFNFEFINNDKKYVRLSGFKYNFSTKGTWVVQPSIVKNKVIYLN